MLKHHRLISFFIGLGFLIILQKFATPEPVFRFLMPAFLLYTGAVTLYNRRYLKQLEKYNVWVLLRPVLLLAAGFGLFLTIPSEFLRGAFLISAVILITVFEIILDNQSENVLLNQTLFIAFGLFFAFFAAYYYSPNYGPFYLAGIFFSSALLTRTFYEFIPKSPKTKLIASITIGLFCSQLFWSLNFLQFHFSVLALFLFNFFYFCLILNYYHFFHILNFKKIQLHLLILAAMNTLVLLATPWYILK